MNLVYVVKVGTWEVSIAGVFSQRDKAEELVANLADDARVTEYVVDPDWMNDGSFCAVAQYDGLDLMFERRF